MSQRQDPQVEEVIEGQSRRTARPNILDWCTLAVEDMAVSVERLNRDLDGNPTNNVIWRDVLDIFSLRRWAFVFPGGGAARGGRIRRVRIRPATPTPGSAPAPMRPTRRAVLRQAVRAQAAQAAPPQSQVPPPPPSPAPRMTTPPPSSVQARPMPPPPPSSSPSAQSAPSLNTGEKIVIESGDFKSDKKPGWFRRNK